MTDLDILKSHESKQPLSERSIDWIKRQLFDAIMRGGEKWDQLKRTYLGELERRCKQ